MKKAVIDIGTNSVKLTLGEAAPDGGAKMICDMNVITKLGGGMRESGALSAEAMERTAQAVAKFADFARAEGADEILCVGTMALRRAANAADFSLRVKTLCGLDVSVLPGEAEAELSSLAAVKSLDGADSGFVTIFDTGGGSTEFVFLKDGVRLDAVSVEAGAVTLTDEYFAKSPANPQTVCFVTSELIKKFAEAGVGREEGRVIGAGGNLTAMAAVAAGMPEYDRARIHGSILTKQEVMRQIALYAQCTAEERRVIPGLSPKRADIILGGACIILAAMEAAKADEITVSDRSLRHELLRRLCAGEGAPLA